MLIPQFNNVPPWSSFSEMLVHKNILPLVNGDTLQVTKNPKG